MTTTRAMALAALGILVIWLFFLPVPQVPQEPSWAERSHFMCVTSESQVEKDFWCN